MSPPRDDGSVRLRLADALPLCDDDRARERIGKAERLVEAELARLPPEIVAAGRDPNVSGVYVLADGAYVVEHHISGQQRSIADLLDPPPASFSRRTPALAALRRQQGELERVKMTERSRALLDRIAAGGAAVYVLRSPLDPAPVGPLGIERLRGMRIVTLRGGELAIRFVNRELGYAPIVIFPPPAPAGDSPRPPSGAAVREAAHAVYSEERAAGRPPPNVSEAEALIRARCPGATRGLIQPILAEPEFMAQRNPRGRHRT